MVRIFPSTHLFSIRVLKVNIYFIVPGVPISQTTLKCLNTLFRKYPKGIPWFPSLICTTFLKLTQIFHQKKFNYWGHILVLKNGLQHLVYQLKHQLNLFFQEFLSNSYCRSPSYFRTSLHELYWMFLILHRPNFINWNI